MRRGLEGEGSWTGGLEGTGRALALGGAMGTAGGGERRGVRTSVFAGARAGAGGGGSSFQVLEGNGGNPPGLLAYGHAPWARLGGKRGSEHGPKM